MTVSTEDQRNVGTAVTESGAERADRFTAAAARTLTHAPNGVAFIGHMLDRLVVEYNLTDAVAIVNDHSLGRQLFTPAHRRLPRGGEQLLHRGAPGVWTNPTIIEDGPDLRALFDLVRLALRMDGLNYQARYDPLTNVLNRRGFDEVAESFVARSRRYGWGFTLAVVDVVSFKLVNDRHGHPAGDVVLQAVANHISSTLRSGDIAGRVGGDEFALLLPSDGTSTPPLLERLKVEVFESGLPDVRLAAGIAHCPKEATDLAGLFALADDRLYEGKAQTAAGRHP